MMTIDDDNLMMILQNWYTEFEFRFTKYIVNSANCLKYENTISKSLCSQKRNLSLAVLQHSIRRIVNCVALGINQCVFYIFIIVCVSSLNMYVSLPIVDLLIKPLKREKLNITLL